MIGKMENELKCQAAEWIIDYRLHLDLAIPGLDLAIDLQMTR